MSAPRPLYKCTISPCPPTGSEPRHTHGPAAWGPSDPEVSLPRGRRRAAGRARTDGGGAGERCVGTLSAARLVVYPRVSGGGGGGGGVVGGGGGGGASVLVSSDTRNTREGARAG